MESSDPAFQALFDAWTAENAEQTWRVRFKDGGIAVFTAVTAHEDEIGKRTANVTVVRQIRRSGDREWVEHDQTYFELMFVKDVTHVETGNVVFPAMALPTRRTTKPRLGAAGVALLGILTLAAGVRDIVTWVAQKNWPTAPAFVQSLEMRPVYRRSSRRVGRVRTTRVEGYTPAAIYRYEVKGIAYVGTVIERGIALPEPTVETAARTVRFKQGDTVPARYDPANPQDAVLVPGGMEVRTVVFLLVAPVLLFGAFLWWHSTMPPKQGLNPD